MSFSSIYFLLLINFLNIYITVHSLISGEQSASNSSLSFDHLNAPDWNVLLQLLNSSQLSRNFSEESTMESLNSETMAKSISSSLFIESSKLETTDEDFTKQLNNRQLGSCPISLSAITSCPLTISSASTSTDSNNTPYTFYYYQCSSSTTSSTTCSSALNSCGVSCTSSIVSLTGYTYYAFATLEISDTWIMTSKMRQSSTSISLSTSYGCDALSAACSMSNSAAILMKKAIGAAAVAFGSGVGVGVAIAKVGLIQPSAVQAKSDAIAQVPENNLQIPVLGLNFANHGGCNDSSIMFPEDGNCYPVLKQGPCTRPFEWLTVDPRTLLGRCTPRICSQGQVFVGRDGLCHDIDDNECQGGRRLYYTAYGDPICDCRIGQFPFPQPEDDCVPLFTQGPCPVGQIVTFSQTGALICSAQTNALYPITFQHNTPSSEVNKDGYHPQIAQASDNSKNDALGCRYLTAMPSPMTNNNPHSVSTYNRQKFLHGYDVFTFKSVCVDVSAPDSPYFNKTPENQLLNEQLGDGPSLLSDPLLIPCRPGAKTDKNFKCTNPLVPKERKRMLLKAIQGNFVCPDDATLQAAGHCGSNLSASCGPSFEYDEDYGECRSIFE